MFIIPNVIRVFLTFFGSVLADFPHRVISHPYCYVHYDVLDTTCVIGCLMNDILILFLCILSRMLFGVFLISFSLVLVDFPRRVFLRLLRVCSLSRIYSGLSYIFGSVLADFPRRVFLRSPRVCLFPRISFEDSYLLAIDSVLGDFPAE